MGHGHETPGHDHGAHAASESHGPAELPPVPAVRSITPARADFERPWPGRLLVWPFVWTAVAGLVFVAARSWGRPFGPATEAHEAGEHGSGPHEAAPHGEPAMGEEAPAMHHEDAAMGEEHGK